MLHHFDAADEQLHQLLLELVHLIECQLHRFAVGRSLIHFATNQVQPVLANTVDELGGAVSLLL